MRVFTVLSKQNYDGKLARIGSLSNLKFKNAGAEKTNFFSLVDDIVLASDWLLGSLGGGKSWEIGYFGSFVTMGLNR